MVILWSLPFPCFLTNSLTGISCPFSLPLQVHLYRPSFLIYSWRISYSVFFTIFISIPYSQAILPPFISHFMFFLSLKKQKEEKIPLKSTESDLCWTSACEHGFCLESCWYTRDHSIKENRFPLCQLLSFVTSFWLGLGVYTHLPSFVPGFCPSWACLMHVFIVSVNSYRYLPFCVCLLKTTITSDPYNLSTPSSA